MSRQWRRIISVSIVLLCVHPAPNVTAGSMPLESCKGVVGEHVVRADSSASERFIGCMGFRPDQLPLSADGNLVVCDSAGRVVFRKEAVESWNWSADGDVLWVISRGIVARVVFDNGRAAEAGVGDDACSWIAGTAAGDVVFQCGAGCKEISPGLKRGGTFCVRNDEGLHSKSGKWSRLSALPDKRIVLLSRAVDSAVEVWRLSPFERLHSWKIPPKWDVGGIEGIGEQGILVLLRASNEEIGFGCGSFN